MLRQLCLLALAVGLFCAWTDAVNAYGPGYYNHVARRAYYDGFGPGYYGRLRNGGYSIYGNGPYGNAYGSYSNGYFPSSNAYGNYNNGYGNVDYFGSSYGSAYRPYGVGVYSSFNNGL
jgi:hypothetical protein